MTCFRHAAAALFAVFVLATPASAQYSIADRYPHLETPAQAQGSVKRSRAVRRAAKPRSRAPRASASRIATPFGVTIPANKSLAGLPAPLAAKARQIVSECGSRIVSTYRPGSRVRGSGRLSLHALRRAVDVAGNPTCIYARLKGWKGGYSIDYRRVQHVHFSYDPGGREWSSRFNHYTSQRRHARR